MRIEFKVSGLKLQVFTPVGAEYWQLGVNEG